MKRVLIVTPHWPPHVYPDMHRARTALPYLSESDWEPLILSIDHSQLNGFQDPDLMQTVPAKTRQWKAGAMARFWLAALGIGDGGWRSLCSLYRIGREILEKEKPDLVFFSTSLFPVMMLGPLWKKQYGVPYVLDFQDPWVPDQRGLLLAKSCLKARLSRALDRRMEPYAVKQAAHIISVSPSYVEMLSHRYALSEDRFTTLPFGAPESDFEIVQNRPVTQNVFRLDDGFRHWVYAGRGGKDLRLALRAIFIALADARRKSPKDWSRLRLHFIGTQYAPSSNGPKSIAQLAAEHGVNDLVIEQTERIGYLESLRCLLDAEAIVVPGSEDPGYTASKIYPCILARKPLLAVFHQKSSVCDVLRKTGAGELVTFSDNARPGDVAARISRNWFERWPRGTPATDWKEFSAYTAHEMTRKMCMAFDRALIV